MFGDLSYLLYQKWRLCILAEKSKNFLIHLLPVEAKIKDGIASSQKGMFCITEADWQK